MIKVKDIAFVSFAAPDLAVMQAFLEAFGMERCEQSDDERLWMRGTGPLPFVHETVRGPARFVGVGFLADSLDDLERLAGMENVAITAVDRPGGGHGVTLIDPDGIRVDVIAGQTMIEAAPLKSRDAWNQASAHRRLNVVRAPMAGPSTVVRLGHCVLTASDIRASLTWWKERFGFIISDEVHDPEGRIFAEFLRCDRGDEPTDHHTLTLAQTRPDEAPGLNHAAFEVLDLDDVMCGHDHLLAKGYRPIWGIGRHVLGSQVFDYWLDPFGIRLEHWTDGDLLAAKDGSNVTQMNVMFSNHWGPPPSAAFLDPESVNSERA